MYNIFAKLLEKNEIKAATVARDTGISNGTFSDWKNGRSTPGPKTLKKIADYFNVSVDYLMTGKERTPAEDGSILAEFGFYYMNMIHEFMKLSEDEKRNVQETIHLFSVKYK